MQKRKRIWWRISNEILEKKGKVVYAVWQELDDAIKGFEQLHDSCFFAKSFGITSWYRKFLRRMEAESKDLGNWKAVAKMSEVGSATWSRAIRKVHEETKQAGILYRWQELVRLLPQGHPLLPEAKKQMSRIRAERKAKKKAHA